MWDFPFPRLTIKRTALCRLIVAHKGKLSTDWVLCAEGKEKPFLFPRLFNRPHVIRCEVAADSVSTTSLLHAKRDVRANLRPANRLRSGTNVSE